MIITIDGPAGAGKSSVARRLAEMLGGQYLDTGALYRAVTWKALRDGVATDDPAALGRLADDTELTIEETAAGTVVRVDGTDVTEGIRSPEIGRNIGAVADAVPVRDALNRIQRRIADSAEMLVTEGRDQGTDVFPDAELKIYLDAPVEERARRRHEQLAAKGVEVEIDEVIADQESRDQQDRSRPVGALTRAEDAVTVETGGLTEEEVIEQLLDLARQRADSLRGGNDE